MMKYGWMISCVLLLGSSGCSSPEGKARKLERQMLEQIPLLFADDVLPVVFTKTRTDSILAACLLFRKRIDEQLNSKPDPAVATILKRADLALQGYELRAERLHSDPSFYDIGVYLNTVLVLNDPIDKRMEYLALQLQRTQAYYAAARANLRPTEAESIYKAIDVQRSTLLFLQTQLPDSIQIASLQPNEKTALTKAVHQSRLELKDYIAFCRSLLYELQNQGIEQELEKKLRK